MQEINYIKCTYMYVPEYTLTFRNIPTIFTIFGGSLQTFGLALLDYYLTASIAQLSVMVAWILVVSANQETHIFRQNNQRSERSELCFFRTVSSYERISMCRKASFFIFVTNFCAKLIVKRCQPQTAQRSGDPFSPSFSPSCPSIFPVPIAKTSPHRSWN